MFAFPKRRQIVTYRRFLYRVGLFYKNVAGHSFLYHLNVLDIMYIWREYRRSVTLNFLTTG